MRISHQYKFVFFANPKTGSESVRQILDPFTDVWSRNIRQLDDEYRFYVHMPPVEAEAVFKELGWDFDAYYRFVFVRNPWARLVSLYEMIWGNRPQKPSFHMWLGRTKPDGSGGGGKAHELWRKFGSYSIDNYIMNPERKVLVNKVIKLEEIGTELPGVLEDLKIPNAHQIAIPHANNRSSKQGRSDAKYVSYYNDETIQLVSERYAYDIHHYGYQFGD